MNSIKYFKLFSNIIVVKGHNRSLILDNQRNSYMAIPDTMEEIISLFQTKKSVDDLIVLYGKESTGVINEYVDFLIENEYGFITDTVEFDLFIDMDTTFEIASHATNCIIEISDGTMNCIVKIIIGLERIYCKDIQFICYDFLSLENLNLLFKSYNESNFRSIELVLKYSDEIFNFIKNMNNNSFRISELILHSSLGRIKEIDKFLFDITYIDEPIYNFKNCGIVDMKYFDGINKYKVLESLNHNSCLNKKISIDQNGDIRNCPAMPESFGNIKDTSLEEALNKSNFKKYWNINKDQISVCKDCEFRHVCTDCRAFTEDPEDQYAKPLKCGYSPYTNVWEEWSTNPLKQKAIEYYGM